MNTEYLSEREIEYQEKLNALRDEYRHAISAGDRKFIRAKAFLLKLCYRKFKDNPLPCYLIVAFTFLSFDLLIIPRNSCSSWYFLSQYSRSRTACLSTSR